MSKVDVHRIKEFNPISGSIIPSSKYSITSKSSKYSSNVVKASSKVVPAIRNNIFSPQYELIPTLMQNKVVELPRVAKPLQPEFPRNPKVPGTDILNGIGDPDPNYGISQEWLVFQRQGDQYDRIREWNPYEYEYNETSYDKLPDSPSYIIPTDYKYQRYIGYNEDNLDEKDENISELKISKVQYPMTILLQYRY